MQIKGYKYFKGEKQWLRDLHLMGSVLGGPTEEVHHAIGRTAEIHVDYIRLPVGAFWCIPLTKQQHLDIVRGRERKAREKELFEETVKRYRASHGSLPFEYAEDIIKCVREWTR